MLRASFRAAVRSNFLLLRSMTTNSKPVETSIRSKLEELLAPTSLLISNDSAQHAHHAPMRDRAASDSEPETHFTLHIVSEAFAGKTTIQRHRLIYGALGEEFDAGLHALSLTAKTRSEMEKRKTRVS